MHHSYLQKDYLENTAVIPQNTTAKDMTGAIPLTAHGSMALRADITYTDATVGAAISAQLQASSDGGVSWAQVASKTVALTAAVATHTVKTILFNGFAVAADVAVAPLPNLVRITLTTGAGDSIALTHIYITQDS
jgi:hypothetical protein